MESRLNIMQNVFCDTVAGIRDSGANGIQHNINDGLASAQQTAGMIKVSIIIPYFQRKPGLLRIALDSIFAQQLKADVAVDVLIVDDESPHPPTTEVAGLSRPGFTVRVIKRPNGGPARARNSGLEAAQDSDFIAFLDSDDSWLPDHLETGLSALRRGAQFFCSNNYYEGDQTWFSGFQSMDRLLADASKEAEGQFSISRETAMAYFLEACLAHTSTVVYDARKLPGLSFDARQERAGEDYLFWITAVDKSERVAFSLNPTAMRGSGIDLYRSALDWNSPECVRRLYFALTLHKKMLARFCQTETQRASLKVKIEKLRRGISYLFMRNALVHFGANFWVMGKLFESDPWFWPALPGNMVRTLVQRMRGRLDFPVG